MTRIGWSNPWATGSSASTSSPIGIVDWDGRVVTGVVLRVGPIVGAGATVVAKAVSDDGEGVAGVETTGGAAVGTAVRTLGCGTSVGTADSSPLQAANKTANATRSVNARDMQRRG